jgi:hypothetical protein
MQVLGPAIGTGYKNKLRRRNFARRSECESIRSDLRDRRFEFTARSRLDRSRVELLKEESLGLNVIPAVISSLFPE